MVAADRELVQRVLSGDPQAIRGFLEKMRCIPRIQAAKNRRHRNGLSEEDLADLAQDTFSLVWERLPTYRGDAPLASWVYAFCVFSFVNALRRRYRHPLRDDSMVVDVTAPVDARGDRLDDEHLYEALERLTPEELQAVNLKAFDGLTFEVMGRRLGISSNTAKTRYYRALDRLRTLLAPGFEEAP